MNPKLYIIAGPNGAGKTTFTERFLPLYTKSREFVNADEIAKRISPSNPESVAIRAGKEMLERVRALAEQRDDFSIETTLSGKSYVPLLRNLKTRGYELHLFFLWLPEVQMAIDRVADRVKNGGHHIPEDVIRRRYAAGIQNCFHVYRTIVDFWRLFDNSLEDTYKIATESKRDLLVFDTERFQKCSKMALKPTDDSLRDSADDPDSINALAAFRLAKWDVIQQHLKTGDPVIIWRDGKVYRQPPEEAKREFEQAVNIDPRVLAAMRLAN